MWKASLPICFLLFFASCRKEKFTSESEWLAPVFQTELSIADLIPDSLRTYNPDSSINIVFQEEYGISSLEDILQIPDKVDTMEVTLSSLVLDDRTFTDTLTLAELYPPSILLNGQKAELDAQEITTDEGTVIDVTEEFFTQATFVEGWIDIEIHNDLPVEAETLEFELRNEQDKEVIVSGVFQNLAPNSSVKDSFSLVGKTVDGVLELIVKKVKTKASDGEVQVNAFKGLRIEFAVRGLKPQKATAIFPSQNLVENKEETEYDFGGAKLTQVFINSGTILMSVESSIEEEILLDYRIPNSYKEGQAGSIQKEFIIPPAPSGEVIKTEEKFPIDGFVIYLWGKDKVSLPNYNLIYNELIASINYSGIERTISLEDKIKIEFGLIDVNPSLIIGDPGKHDINVLDTLDIAQLSKLSGNINLEDAKIELGLFNSFGIETLINIDYLQGQNTTEGSSVNLNAGPLLNPIFLNRATNPPLTPVELDLNIDKSNSNLKPFLENIPDRIIAKLDATVNPYGTLDQGDFGFAESKLSLDLKVNIPLNVGLDSLNLQTVKSLNLENESWNNIKEGKLLIRVKNTFPIEAGLLFEFKDSENNILFKKSLDDDSRITAAEIDPLTGKTVHPQETDLTITLTESEINLLRLSESLVVNVFFETKDAKRVKIFSDYSVSLKLNTNFIYENRL